MVPVEAGDAVVEAMADGVLGDAVEGAADEVPERMATEDVASYEDDVDCQRAAGRCDGSFA